MEQRILREIWIYPIKSLGGISLNEASILPKGIEHDRRWMLIDEHNRFITQRLHPVMALFKLSRIPGGIHIAFQQDGIDLLFHEPLLPEPITATIWNDTVVEQEVNKKFSVWFSERMGFACRLVAFPEVNPRAVDPAYAINHEHVSLADAYPFLVISRASLELLNSKLEEPVPMNRFRPNFVVDGCEPHEEDTWRDFTIGHVRFTGVKPCSRCVLITINQDTAEAGTEPLRTLATYRRNETKVLFGQNLLTHGTGTVRVGDVLRIESFR